MRAAEAVPEIIDPGRTASDLCFARTGANPIGPHMIAVNATRVVVSFVANGHVLRNARERVNRTLWFEGVGLALVAVLSVVVVLWSACFSTAFDRIERRFSGRVAHALLHEATAVIATCPVIVGMTGLDWSQALAADLALTPAYTAYAYAFHRVFDRVRPVAPVVEQSRS